MKIVKSQFNSIDDDFELIENNVVIINEQSRDIKFKLRDDLIYYTFDENKKRLCIFAIIKQKIFRLIHDFNNHDDFYRTYDRIVNSIYIR